MATDTQVPWSDEQWARVRRVVQEEASRARVAATFLPLYGPLPADTDYVSTDRVVLRRTESGRQRLAIEDTTTMQLPTLQVKVFLRGAQMADPELSSVLTLFRRAANVLARLEDSIVFNGQPGPGQGPANAEKLPEIWEVSGGNTSRGLYNPDDRNRIVIPGNSPGAIGENAVGRIAAAVGQLEDAGYFGPYALVLGQKLFTAVETPNRDSLVLPQDRIIPFLGGGSLLRSSTLDPNAGVMISLGGAPVELVIATDVSLAFMQVTTDPMYAFRVYEKMALRIKEPEAIVMLSTELEPGDLAPANSHT